MVFSVDSVYLLSVAEYRDPSHRSHQQLDGTECIPAPAPASVRGDLATHEGEMLIQCSLFQYQPTQQCSQVPKEECRQVPRPSAKEVRSTIYHQHQ